MEVPYTKMNKKIESPNDCFLLDSGKIFLWGDIEEETARNFVRSIRYIAKKNIKEINIYIHSSGGDVDAACAIIDEIIGFSTLGFTINTIAIGKCYSAAAYILSFGTNRYATENSTIMLHPILFDLDIDYIDAQRSYTEFTNRKYKEIISRVAKNCGHRSKRSIESFMSIIKDGLWMSPSDSIEFGLVDDLWEYSIDETNNGV